jgi:hypothetical protein
VPTPASLSCASSLESSLLTTVFRRYRIVLGGDGSLLADQLGIWRPNPSACGCGRNTNTDSAIIAPAAIMESRANASCQIWPPRLAAIPMAALKVQAAQFASRIFAISLPHLSLERDFCRRHGDQRRDDARRTSSIAHLANRRPAPVEIRPHVGAALAAGLADEPRLEIGELEIVRPAVRTERSNGCRCSPLSRPECRARLARACRRR